MPPRRPPEFHAAKRLQREYEKGIRRITSRVLTRPGPEQTLEQWLAELRERSQRQDVHEASEELARRMVVRINVGNMRTWREAASRSNQAGRLHKLLQAEMAGPTGARVQQLVRENAKYIRSVSTDAAQALVDEVRKAQQSGARPGTVSKMMKRRFPELLKSKTNLISRTETQKASTALTQARCERLNLDWFEWETSRDQRTRESHKNMNGVLCSWGGLPSPEALVGEAPVGAYAPGQIYNCRCLVVPLLAFSDVDWPHRVYHNGSITQMSLPQFKQLAAGADLAA